MSKHNDEEHRPITTFLWEEGIPFENYILYSRELIKRNREDLDIDTESLILEINTPFELRPETKIGAKIKYGALLIHGLFDSPFSLRDIANNLYNKGVHCRSLLLPGHGTRDIDLHHVSCHDWIKAVDYGINSFKNQVDKLFLIGYSTGAALSVIKAAERNDISGTILLSPAISLSPPVNFAVKWHELARKKNQWIATSTEKDYAKYHNFGVNPVKQVISLTKLIKENNYAVKLKVPMFMILSSEDETISSKAALDFFMKNKIPHSQVLLYSSRKKNYTDARIKVQSSVYPELNIKHFSHISIPFSPTNSHYGVEGDYVKAARPNEYTIYGAYNRIEIDLFDRLYKLKLARHMRRELTYNPDFENMTNLIYAFISRA